MATFPTLTPGGRTFTPGDYPHSQFTGLSGVQNRVRNSNVMLSSQLRLQFVAITESQMLGILAHYQGQSGGFLSFPLPSAVWSGVSSVNDYQLAGYGWRYIKPPMVTDSMCADAYDVEVELESVPPEGTSIAGLNANIGLVFTAGSASVIGYAMNAAIGYSFSGGAASVASSGDPNFSSVSLLLHMDGSNGSTTFTDSSSNALTVTASGGAQISTADAKWGTGSLRVLNDVNSIQYITTASSSALSFPGDFTIEMWVKCDSSQTATYKTLFELGLYTDGILFRDDALYVNGSALKFNTNLLNTSWRHVALTRSGSTVRLFYDGISQSLDTSTLSGTINTGNNPIRIGASRHTGGQHLNGYFDDVRITKGAWYAANFTPPAAAFPNS